ncbi:MAG TPA: hypothetical protein VGQ36_18150 [Thermoanaerobaculia bacterium]|nr:hypothetical protein [Thermoanaerobaculia bacterium]
MKRPLVIAFVAVALFGCGGDEVKFDLDNPPPWLKKLDASLPAKPLQRGELSGNCLDRQIGECRAQVRASKSMARKAKFQLVQGQEVKVTYLPNEKANAVTVTLRRDREATVPVRRSGGILTFRCVKSIDPCVIAMP